ncbi:MAG: cation-efflux pump [Patescibacteria group bacterium]|nr:cation-efflux pump [Patescibacteria group bacterium]
MNTNKKKSVALSSVLASFALTILKLAVGLLTGSVGILSEAAHSALDFGAASLTFFAVSVGDKPADTKHPYGHGKVESVSALIETGLLFLTSAWIIYEAVHRLIARNTEVEITWYSFAVIIVAIIIDYSRSQALTKVAKQTNSQALEADALHFSSDILSSLVVLVGLIFVLFGIRMADSLAAIGVSLFVLHAGYSLGKRTIDVLIDAVPEGLTEKVTEIAKKVQGVINVEKIRVRPVGASVFVDMVVTVSRKLPLESAQSIVKSIEKQIREIIPETDITIHTKPLHLSSETIIEQVQIISANNNLSVHDIAVHEENGRKYLSFDLEVDADLTIGEAHSVASKLEEAVRNEIGDVEINTHIEPLKAEVITGSQLTTSEEKDVRTVITDIIKRNKDVLETHDVKIRKAQGKLFMSIHCLFANKTLLENAHNTASRIEYLIREKLPNTKRVVVHAEPLG